MPFLYENSDKRCKGGACVGKDWVLHGRTTGVTKQGLVDNLRKELKQKRGDRCHYHFLAGGRERHRVPCGRWFWMIRPPISHLLRIIFLISSGSYFSFHKADHCIQLGCNLCSSVKWLGGVQLRNEFTIFATLQLKRLIWKLNFRSFSCSCPWVQLSEYVDLKIHSCVDVEQLLL